MVITVNTSREYDPFRTYRPYFEYCDKCRKPNDSFSEANYPTYFHKPISRKCWKCGSELKHIFNITFDERKIIGEATDNSKSELVRMSELKNSDPSAFRKQINEWLSIPHVDNYMNNICTHIYRCDWCIEHNEPDNRRQYLFKYKFHYELSNTKSKICPCCGRTMTALGMTNPELGTISQVTNHSLSVLDELRKLKNEDTNKYYWKLGEMQAKHLHIRYPGEPIPIENLIIGIPYAIVVLIKYYFFSWPYSIMVWILLLIVMASLEGCC